MAIIVKPISTDYPENAWTYAKSPDGSVKLTCRTRGPAKDLAELAEAFSPGQIITLEADETMPFAGTFVTDSVALNWDGPGGFATLDRVYASLNNGGSFSLGENNTEINETLDFQTMEKPLTSAPFWRNTSEGAVEDAAAQARGMKAVQAYIDAEDHTKGIEAASKILGYAMTEAHLKMAAKRIQGVEAYYVAAPVLQRSETTTTKPTNVGQDIAKIITDPDIDYVPVPDGFEWLGGGVRVTWNGTAYTYERTWIGAEKWDRDLYEEA